MQVESLGHVVLRVRDLARSEAFYHGVLGLPISARAPAWSMVFFTLGEHHDFAIRALGPEAAPCEEERLGLDHYISRQFTPEEMLPAAAQGVIGIECLEANAELRAVLARLNHGPTVQTTVAERAIAKTLQASCQSPVATHAGIDGSTMTVTALVAMPDGSDSIKDTVAGPVESAEALGVELANKLLTAGAGELLAAVAAGND